MNNQEKELNKPENLIEKIESIFNFNQELEKVPTTLVETISAFENKSNQLLDISKTEIKTIEDKEYIDTAFKTMIKCGLDGLEVITKSIKIGSSGKDLEGFARWADSVSMTLERLVNYKMKIRDIELMMNPEVVKPQAVQNNIFMDGKEMSEMLKKIKSESQLNAIVVDFKVEDSAFEEKPPSKE